MSEGMLKAVITGIFAVIAALITAASTIWSAYIQAQTVNRVDESNGQNVPSVSIEEVTPEQQYDVQEEHPVPTQGNDLNVEDSIDTKSELDEKILNAQHTYQRAITLYENGQYEEALLAFSELGNYSGNSHKQRESSLTRPKSSLEVDQNNENWNKMKNLMNQNYQVAFLKATMNDDLSEYLGEYYDD